MATKKLSDVSKEELESYSNNVYLIKAHGYHSDKTIKLNLNERVIMVGDGQKCRTNNYKELFSLININRSSKINSGNKITAKSTFRTKNFFKRLKYSDDFIVYHNTYISDIILSGTNTKFPKNSVYFRRGFYKLPLEIELRKSSKLSFVNQSKNKSIKAARNSGKINTDNMSWGNNVQRIKPYTTIKSEHVDFLLGERYSLIDFILYIREMQKASSDSGFTLFVNACREYEREPPTYTLKEYNEPPTHTPEEYNEPPTHTLEENNEPPTHPEGEWREGPKKRLYFHPAASGEYAQPQYEDNNNESNYNYENKNNAVNEEEQYHRKEPHKIPRNKKTKKHSTPL